MSLKESSQLQSVPDLDAPSSDSEEKLDRGVKTIIASHKVYGRYSRWVLFVSLGLAAYVYSLDGSTTYTYLIYPASSFGHHSLIGSIGVAQGIIVAVGKPITAKVADLTTRGIAYMLIVIFYVIGYIIIASSKTVNALAGGIVIYAMGYSGSQILTQIIIADITPLQYRGLVSSLIFAPFLINGFIGSNVSAQVIQHVGWRWGYGMFAILIPASIAPLIVTLLWAESKARKLRIVTAPIDKDEGSEKVLSSSDPILNNKSHSFLSIIGEMDIVGLLLLSACVALVLLPLTLVETAKGRWHNPSMIAMLVVGIVLIPVFVIWEWKGASNPIIPLRFLKNRSAIGAALIGFFDFISFYLTSTYLYSFVVVVKPWTTVNVNYFSQTQTIGLTFFGILAGLAMRFIHGYKVLLIVGLCIRLLGVGLMIHSRGANAPDSEVVMTQIIQGLGGGIASTATQVAAQASVPHADLAKVTAFVLLITEIGGSVGNAIAGAIWTNYMPGKLAEYLPFVSDTDRATLFGSITTIVTEPRGTPVREGAIQAYGDVMKIMLICATVFSVLPIILAFWMPEHYLGQQQNAADNTDLSGNVVVGASQRNEELHDK